MAASLHFDDSAFSPDDIQSGSVTIYSTPIHDSYHTGTDSINTKGS